MARRLSNIFGSRFFCIAMLLAVMTDSLPYAAHAEQPMAVSIIELIARPEQYDGKFVRVVGFLRIEFEGTALYLHQSDYDNALTKNGLWVTIDMTRKELDKKYVLLEGTFKADNHGHMGLWSGAITDIKRAQVTSDPQKPVWKK